MAGVAEQSGPAARPDRQRISVEERPDEAGLGRPGDAPDLRVPVGKRGKRPLDRGAVGPVLAVPLVVLGPAYEIEQPAARDKVMDEVPAGADPGLRTEFKPEIGDPLDRNEPAIGDTAGELRRLVAEKPGADSRMNAVGADQHIGLDTRAVGEPGLDAVAAIGEIDESAAEMDVFGGKSRGDDREEIGPVDRQMRRAVEFLAERVEPCPLQGAAVLPAPLMRAARPDPLAQQPLGEPQAIERTRTAFGPILMPPPTSVSSGACS